MLQPIWTWIVSFDYLLYRSPLFFLLIAHATQFLGCCVFSMLDLKRNRVPLSAMWSIAGESMAGFVPFIAMWYTGVLGMDRDLPKEAPPLLKCVAQLVLCGLSGDFLHYCTHRLLHSNRILRQHIHRVHHEYEGSLYSWVGMQVHPFEVLLITIAIYGPFLLIAHPMVLWVFTFLATANATCVHSGYESGLGSLKMPFALSSSDHQLHHDLNSTKNYGNILRIWDDTFHTYGSTSKHPTQSIWGKEEE